MSKEEKENYKYLCKIVRLALTGQEIGPNLFLLMEILGYDRCVERLNEFIYLCYKNHNLDYQI